MLDTNKHKQIMLKILKDIYGDHILAQVLGFKGGTMAFLFYGLSRFSVDLDFDSLDKEQEKYVYEKIKSILVKYGTVKQDDNKRYSIFFMLSYGAGQHNIKIDINKRDFMSSYETRNILGINLLIMKKEDMVAHKMVAMYERMGEAMRDIFDVHYFLSNDFEFNKIIISNRTNLEFKDFIENTIAGLLEIKKNELLGGLGELVDEKQKFWIKNKMIDDTIFQLRLLVV